MDYKRVLVLHYTNGMSGREIAEATGDGKTTVNEFLKRFRECEELSYPLSEEVTNEFIAERLYRKAGKPAAAELYRDFDPEEVCRTLTKKGETLKHLWRLCSEFSVNARFHDKTVHILRSSEPEAEAELPPLAARSVLDRLA